MKKVALTLTVLLLSYYNLSFAQTEKKKNVSNPKDLYYNGGTLIKKEYENVGEIKKLYPLVPLKITSNQINLNIENIYIKDYINENKYGLLKIEFKETKYNDDGFEAILDINELNNLLELINIIDKEVYNENNSPTNYTEYLYSNDLKNFKTGCFYLEQKILFLKRKKWYYYITIVNTNPRSKNYYENLTVGVNYETYKMFFDLLNKSKSIIVDKINIYN